MKPKPLLFILAIFLVFPFFACDQVSEPVKKLTATKIKDILDHPRKFENKEVSIYGTVTETASLLVVKFFTIQDDTGSIRVITHRVLPGNGEKLEVTGFMESLEIGTERWIVLREKGSDAEKGE
jgi:hypothetical protein